MAEEFVFSTITTCLSELWAHLIRSPTTRRAHRLGRGVLTTHGFGKKKSYLETRTWEHSALVRTSFAKFTQNLTATTEFFYTLVWCQPFWPSVVWGYQSPRGRSLDPKRREYMSGSFYRKQHACCVLSADQVGLVHPSSRPQFCTPISFEGI